MKASELAQNLADSVGIKKQQATDLLKNLGVAVSTTLKAGDEIVLPGVGKIVAVKRAARTGRDLHTGATVEYPAKTVAKLKPSTELKNALSA